ncbi:MAG TPA: AAA family ATPase [Solirubrobacteraceae bacterium]|nr:AAA family ATPase [Solirubrobacteraceae bacterium]
MLRERSQELGALAKMLAEVGSSGQGRLALVYGEAGIGKSTLLRRFSEDASGSARVLWGKCDELYTPRPLGPMFEIAGRGGPLAELLHGGEATPYEVTSLLMETLVADPPTIVVLEDMHLADEATLDVLRLLGGRASSVPALIIATYRDDALDRWHPLRLVLGEVAGASPLERMRLQRLSPETVARMAADNRMLSEELYLKTAGNPFFVAEALASGEAQIPDTVRDAVLGRAARLSAGARRLMDAVAVAGPQSDLAHLRGLAQRDIDFLEETIASGMVGEEGGAIAFRHELARLAIEDSIPVHELEALHRRALELLSQSEDGVADPARLAHHAEALGDGRLVLEFAPLAAAQASRLGAHREAAVHYRHALRFAELVPLDARARLFAGCAQESFLIVQFGEAVAAQREAVGCYEQLGDRRRLGASLSFLAHLLWNTGGGLAEALVVVERALALLEDSPDPLLVEACCESARLQLACEDPATASTMAARAQRLAEDLDDAPSKIGAVQTVGWVQFFTGARGGLEKLVESLEMSKRSGDDWMAVAACVIIVRTACRRREYAVAEQYIDVGLELCSVGDYDIYRYYLLSWRSKVLLARGRWSDAAQVAHICLADPCPFARIHALVALGLVRARRGDPDVWAPLDEALALARPRHELQWIAPVAIARAEAAWLEGRAVDAIAETELGDQPPIVGTWWSAGLAYWRWRAGLVEPSVDVGEEPYRLEMAGDWVSACERWQAIGCPYEAAFALLDADQEGLRWALGEMRRLGADPAAKVFAGRLREIGARGLPRGPRASTRENPSGLTTRELEVLGLLAEGQRNAQIAEHLVVSEKTVAHHVSAILRKLDVHTRGEASAEALRIGLVGPR